MAKKILLVDDEKSILQVICWELESYDFDVTKASSGEEAIQILTDNHYDLVITDLMMGKLSGIDVLKSVKELYSDTGTIILTGRGDMGSAIESLKLGAVDYLQKPYDIEELIHKINLSFEKQDLLVALASQNEQLIQEVAVRKVIETELKISRDSLDQQVTEKTSELTDTITKLKTAMQTVKIRENELVSANEELKDINTTLNVILKRRDKEAVETKKEMSAKIIASVIPLLKKVLNRLSGSNKDYLETAYFDLMSILSEQKATPLIENVKLAPRELQVIHYIKQDKTSQEIADILGVTLRTVESYRKNIREKIGIKNKKKNLKKFITSLP